MTPIEAGAAVNPSGRVKALTGLAISTKGVTATYDVQLLFFVPPVGSDEKIVLLGYSYGLSEGVGGRMSNTLPGGNPASEPARSRRPLVARAPAKRARRTERRRVRGE